PMGHLWPDGSAWCNPADIHRPTPSREGTRQAQAASYFCRRRRALFLRIALSASFPSRAAERTARPAAATSSSSLAFTASAPRRLACFKKPSSAVRSPSAGTSSDRFTCSPERLGLGLLCSAPRGSELAVLPPASCCNR